MFDNVLVGYDGGCGGHDAVALARQLAGPTAEFTLSYAYGTTLPTARAGAVLAGTQREDAEQILSGGARAAGLDARLAPIEETSAGRGLARLAAERGSDLLVLEACAQRGLTRLLLGDDTAAALHHARCPIALARPGWAPGKSALASIAVAFDGRRESEAALLSAATLTHRLGTGKPEVVSGATREELVTLGGDVDLLVLGSRSRAALHRPRNGSLAGYLARRAVCNLLVIPEAAVEDVLAATRWPSLAAMAAGASYSAQLAGSSRRC